MKMADSNHDGMVTKVEFLALVVSILGLRVVRQAADDDHPGECWLSSGVHGTVRSADKAEAVCAALAAHTDEAGLEFAQADLTTAYAESKTPAERAIWWAVSGRLGCGLVQRPDVAAQERPGRAHAQDSVA